MISHSSQSVSLLYMLGSRNCRTGVKSLKVTESLNPTCLVIAGLAGLVAFGETIEDLRSLGPGSSKALIEDELPSENLPWMISGRGMTMADSFRSCGRSETYLEGLQVGEKTAVQYRNLSRSQRLSVRLQLRIGLQAYRSDVPDL